LFPKQAANSLVTETLQYFVFFCRSVYYAILVKYLIINDLRLILAILFFTAFLNFTYVGRHTWASVAKQKGVPEEVISDCMGHTSLRTTRIYIALLDTSRIDYANRVVVHGKKVNKSLFKYGAVP